MCLKITLFAGVFIHIYLPLVYFLVLDSAFRVFSLYFYTTSSLYSTVSNSP